MKRMCTNGYRSCVTIERPKAVFDECSCEVRRCERRVTLPRLIERWRCQMDPHPLAVSMTPDDGAGSGAPQNLLSFSQESGAVATRIFQGVLLQALCQTQYSTTCRESGHPLRMGLHGVLMACLHSSAAHSASAQLWRLESSWWSGAWPDTLCECIML
jgi:hypothetical protein